MIKIEKKFENLDKEKKDRIINSSLKEFSKNTFEKASTNKIIKEANISKGLLFHYFKNKKNLFEYLENFTVSTILDRIIGDIDWEQGDIFIRLKEISIIKLRIFQRYPYLSEFSLRVFQNKTLEEISYTYPDFPMEKYTQIYSYNIDYSLFKESVVVEKAIDIIRWTLEKYSEEKRKTLKKIDMDLDYREMEGEIYQYIDMLRKCFYK